MVLPGFQIPAWVGWLGGTLFSNHPCTFSVFKSWKSPYTLYVIVLNAFWLALFLDYTINRWWTEQSSSGNSQSGINYVSSFVTNGFLVTFLVCFLILKLYFIMKAKKISAFMKTLELYPVSTVPVNLRKLRRWCSLVAWLSFSLKATLAVIAAFTLSFSSSWSQVNKSAVLFGIQMPRPIIFILTLVFATLPAYLVSFVAFTFVLFTLSNLLWIFEDFAIQVETAFKNMDGFVVSFQNKYFGVLQQQPQPNKNNFTDLPIQDGNAVKCEMVTIKKIIGQFVEIKNLFKKYDELAGPMILILIVSSTLSTIQAANDIVLKGGYKEGGSAASAWVSLVSHLLFFMILQLGQKASVVIQEKKDKLTLMIALLPRDSINTEYARVINLIVSWNWKLNAANFFSVERSLMGKIVSAMLTYVVILFQLQLGQTTDAIG